MLTLASMIWAAYMFWYESPIKVKYIPMPVTISEGGRYEYSEIYSAITVPANWTDSCYNQQQIIREMGQHFNSFRNGQNKWSQDKILNLSNTWVCVK